MYKAVFYNLANKFPIHEILASNTFEPAFREWTDEEYIHLTDFKLIVYYSPQVELNHIKSMRDALKFKNIKLMVFCDELDTNLKRDAIVYGADFIELIPDSTDDLASMLKKSFFQLKESQHFPHAEVDPFKLAILEIFSTMAMMDVEVEDIYLKTSRFHFGDLSSLMALAGKHKGIIMMSLFSDLAKQIISNIMAVPESDLEEEDVHDGVGELINMIAGGAKARIADSNEQYLLSAPSVITGFKHRVIQQKDMPCVVMVFKSGNHYFAVQVCLMALLGSDSM